MTPLEQAATDFVNADDDPVARLKALHRMIAIVDGRKRARENWRIYGHASLNQGGVWIASALSARGADDIAHELADDWYTVQVVPPGVEVVEVAPGWGPLPPPRMMTFTNGRREVVTVPADPPIYYQDL